ncbi:MAG TPA: hypothetical protein VH044_10950, partial [Polyangiaceae bacterium]|nr:hypothetical protein [Polyangiaceae bacterium]
MVAVAKKKGFDELYQAIRDLPEGQRDEILTPGELHVTMGRPGNKHRRAAQVLHIGLASSRRRRRPTCASSSRTTSGPGS